MARIPYVLVDAFASAPGAGNRVAIVLDARGMALKRWPGWRPTWGSPRRPS
jgi:predicted PhzF superfamily epimerase YddE/YHI9